ncbi:MAG: hypothetical protein NC337_06410 [Roseburia sp.]|nr:hypothetical protein [Roseburia sp.]
MSDFKEALYQRKSFIYQVGGDYYAIGANTFAKITDSPEVDTLELLRTALEKGNDRQIAKYLDKLVRTVNAYRVDAKEHFRQRERLFRFLDALEREDEAAYRQLQEQLFQFDALMEKYNVDKSK